MKNNLWTSRHPMPDEIENVVKKEILWSVEFVQCSLMWIGLFNEYDKIYGVFPAQAIEALNSFERQKRVYSAVSRAVYEENSSKVRKFEFVRWACLDS